MQLNWNPYVDFWKTNWSMAAAAVELRAPGFFRFLVQFLLVDVDCTCHMFG
jgi:hypothetical protein